MSRGRAWQKIEAVDLSRAWLLLVDVVGRLVGRLVVLIWRGAIFVQNVAVGRIGCRWRVHNLFGFEVRHIVLGRLDQELLLTYLNLRILQQLQVGEHVDDAALLVEHIAQNFGLRGELVKERVLTGKYFPAEIVD